MLSDFRGETQHSHDLGYAGASDAFAAGDFGLVGGPVGNQAKLAGLSHFFSYRFSLVFKTWHISVQPFRFFTPPPTSSLWHLKQA